MQLPLGVCVEILAQDVPLEEGRKDLPTPWNVGHEPTCPEHHEHPHHESSDDAILDVVRGDLQQDANRGWNGLHVVTPIDVLDSLNHEHAHHHQGWPSRQGRDGGQEWCEEDADKVQAGDDERRHARAAALIDTCHGLAIRRHRARAKEPTHKGAHCVGHEGGVAARECLRLGWIHKSTEVGCGVEEAHRADEVHIEQGEEGVPEAHPVQVRSVPSHDGASGNVARLTVLAIGIAAIPAGKGSLKITRRLDLGSCEGVARSLERLWNPASTTTASLTEAVNQEHLLGSVLVAHRCPAAHVHHGCAKASRVEAAHHGMACIWATTLEGGVPTL
mmetsp:Transcript_29057/g.64273  ORF Transcript_29057/g.64273 Transcript_29057/m.64273 type:complete len:332 (-) Transcript_29057:604-1599(-)